MRITHHSNRAGAVVLEQNFLPGLAAIGSAKDAALGVRTKCVSEGGDKSDVRIARVDDDRTDVARVLEADIRPGAAGVGGFVNSITVRDIAAKAGFAASRVQYVGIGVRHRDGADRRDALVVEYRRPTESAVGALKNASGDGAEIISAGIARTAHGPCGGHRERRKGH